MISGKQPILLSVWQEVGRHLEISESVEALWAILREEVPLARIMIHQFIPAQNHVRLIAAAPASGNDESPGELQLSDQQGRQLARWLKSGTSPNKRSHRSEIETVLRLLGQAPGDVDSFVAPLVGEHGSRGILTAFALPNHRFSPPHVGLLKATQDPMGTALDNDARLHELAALREAAEADRESLLHRLGRKQVGDVIVGEQSGLRQVMERADMVSRSDVPVLILGETGTGKELVARAIHNRSDRHDGPFIRVNCGAIPRELIDAQLFGHEKGAFTGATESRPGWFERADMGTLFLDEIGELPLEAQVRFLRVLQDGFVERVGGTKSIRVNVRVVAATHRDLAGMVRENSFREDLWYRIAVFPILLPPLCERSGDIPELARHFAERAAVRFGLSPVMPNDADIQLLTTYDWPGNIRELGTVIDRAAILGNGQSLEIAAALGIAAPHRPVRPTTSASHTLQSVLPASPRVAPLADAMRQHIEAALRTTHGRVEGPLGAARLLGINPHTLRARMRKLGIDWTAFRTLE